MANHRRCVVGAGITLALSGALGAPAVAQTIFNACYVRGTGTVSLINVSGVVRTVCGNFERPFTWTDGAGALRSGSPADGDLSGAFPNPLVVRLRGRLIDATAPTDGQILRFDAASGSWKPATPSGGGGTTDHGQLTGLLDDDHPQYLLADGARSVGSGFAVSSNGVASAVPASGPGMRLMWYAYKRALRAGQVDATEWDDVNIGMSSIALGYNTKATELASIALGRNTTASGDGSLAGGIQSTAGGTGSIALGVVANASGAQSTALGTGTTASGDFSTALGRGTTASGRHAMALGFATTSSGEVSTALGSQTAASAAYALACCSNATASNQFAIALGSASTASGWASTAIGNNSTASGDYSTAIGPNTNASGNASMAMGFLVAASGGRAVALGERVTASGANSTVMGFNASTNDQEGSFVYGDRSFADAVQPTGPNQFVVRASGGFYFRTHNTLLTGCNLPSGSGSWDCSSSVTLKTDFEPVDGEDVLTRVRGLPVQRWSYRGEVGVRHLGTFAEDFRQAFGLGTGETTIGMIDMDGVNLAAAQALERRTRDLLTRLAEREEEIRLLRAQLADVVRRLEQLEGNRH